MRQKQYIAIDLKSFYASVECVDRGLDPLNTNLVVADPERTEKTICLAVSPSLKSFGIPGRPRLFEVITKTNAINLARKRNFSGDFLGKSYVYSELRNNSRLEVDYIIAPPRMARYIEYSTEIYKVYLKYIAPEDIHVYSIDEVFIDATGYLSTYKTTARGLCEKIIQDVLQTTGITATAGIGTNLYLAKVAMDIVAKKLPADKNGVRIAELDEKEYRKQLWEHKPITDFWRVGVGYAKRLETMGLFTMGDIAKCSIGRECEYFNEELLYKAFGVNAELLIDHAWGHESCTMEDIKKYQPQSTSLGSGQVLHCPYDFYSARLAALEMADQLSIDLTSRARKTNTIVLSVNYDSENLKKNYSGEVATDYYGRAVPKQAHGTKKLIEYSSSAKTIMRALADLFDEIVNKDLLIRRINLVACNTLTEEELQKNPQTRQISIFDFEEKSEDCGSEEKDEKIQRAMVDIKQKFGKNAIVKGMNLEDGATAISRNEQIGGHKA